MVLPIYKVRPVGPRPECRPGELRYVTTSSPDGAGAKSSPRWAPPSSPGLQGTPPPVHSFHLHGLRKGSAQLWVRHGGGGDAGIDLGAKSDPCHSRNSGGLDLRAAGACRGRAAPRPRASPAPPGAGHGGGHPGRRRRTAPRTPCGPGRAAGGALRLPFHLPREGASGAGDAGAGGGGAPGRLRGEGTLRAVRAHTTGSPALPVSVGSRWEIGAGRRAGVGPPSPGRK